jgi:hypothetical protein
MDFLVKNQWQATANAGVSQRPMAVYDMVEMVATDSSSPGFCRNDAPPYLMERCDSAQTVNGTNMLQRWLSALPATRRSPDVREAG